MSSLRATTNITTARKKAKKGGWTLTKVQGSVYRTSRSPKSAPASTAMSSATKTKSFKVKGRNKRYSLMGAKTGYTLATAKKKTRDAQKKGMYARRAKLTSGKYVIYTAKRK